VRVLFDANTPAPLIRFLKKHQVTRADELGWQSLANGKLLAAAEEAGFDILVTCDQNMRYQQNLTGFRLSIVVLSTNHWPTLRLAGMRIASSIDFAQRGKVSTIDVVKFIKESPFT
jgi:hypothetical protein